MTTKIVTSLTLMSILATAACDNFGQSMTAHTDVVARAAGHELKVDRTAALITSNPQIPAQPDVVLAVANLWVDYMLLATAAAQDTTLHNISLDAVVNPIVDQDIVNQLHDQVIKVDTALTDDQLKRLFEQSGPGAEIRARHVLISLPADASPAQRDSVTKLAQQVRQQAASGANFADLAKRYSNEPGAATSGGDLGFFARGRMVAPFDEAAFKLNPGQISEIVETPFGLHVIKVEERRNANFEEHKAEFRAQTVQQRIQDADQGYVKTLTDPLKMEVQEGAYEVVKDLGTKPQTELRGRAASRPLVKYQGGAFTSKEYVEFVRRLQPPMRASIPQRQDAELKTLLESLARQQILVEEARRKKITMPQNRLDSLKNGIYSQLVQVTQAAGLLGIKPQEGENKEQAIERRVNALIESTVKGEQNLIPLGPLAYSLRDQFGGEVFERSVPAVVTKIEALRPPVAPGTAPQPMPQPPADTSARRQ